MARGWRSATIIATTAIALALAGCASPAPTPPAAESQEIDAATADAIRFRTELGLRADVEYVRAVAADPTAVMDFGIPLLPAEAREIERRSRDAENIVPVVQTYATRVPDEYGGVYIDQAHGGRITVLFTDNLAQHDAALRERLAGIGVVVLRQVRYSEAALTDLQLRISGSDAWFATIPAKLQGVGLDTIGNRIDVSVSTKNPAIQGLVIDHFGVEAAMVNVSSDGTGAAFLPVATIRGRIVTADGNAPGPGDYDITATSDGPGICGGDIDGVGHGAAADGTFEIPCNPGTWTITIRQLVPGADWLDLGHADVVVPEGGIVDMTITLDPPPD